MTLIPRTATNDVAYHHDTLLHLARAIDSDLIIASVTADFYTTPEITTGNYIEIAKLCTRDSDRNNSRANALRRCVI